MLKFPNMEHDEPYMAHVKPGQKAEIIWTFNRAGTFDFACLIPGHYDAGIGTASLGSLVPMLRAQVLTAQGRWAEALEIYRKSIIQALADVENALIAVQQTAIHEKLQLAAVAAARRAYQITEVRLREGTVDVVTLLNIQLTLLLASVKAPIPLAIGNCRSDFTVAQGTGAQKISL